MDIINGAVLPRYHAAPATGAAAAASVADARVSGHLQLLRRVRVRGSGGAGLLQATTTRAGVARRFFSPPTPRHGRTIGCRPARCTLGGSSSDGDGAAAADFDASGEEFVDSSVMEAGWYPSISFISALLGAQHVHCLSLVLKKSVLACLQLSSGACRTAVSSSRCATART